MPHQATVESVDPAVWSDIARRFHDYSYRQSVAFAGALAERRGARSEFVAVMSAGDALGVANVRVKVLPFVGGGIAYISGGPMVRVEGESEREHGQRLLRCIRALRTEYTRERGLVLRILPAAGSESWNRIQGEVLRAEGFAAAPRPAGYRTMLVDVTRPRDAIRSDFRQKWRNCLNAAEGKALTVRCGTERELFDSFEILYRDLLLRKGFAVDLDAGFYASIHEGLDDRDKFRVSLAYEEDEVVAGHIASLLGDTCVYLLGAANERGLKSRASYLLQWEAICEAQRRGMRYYDLGGIDPVGNPGVYHFKRGLGARHARRSA